MSYTVTFDANGGAGAPEPGIVYVATRTGWKEAEVYIIGAGNTPVGAAVYVMTGCDCGECTAEGES